jgi:hypothetical protein
MSRELLLNITPIQYPQTVCEVELLPYDSADQLKTLRREHGSTHVFRRSGETVQCVARARDAPLLGGTRTEIQLRESQKLVAALAQDALLTWFFSKGLLSNSFDPIGVVGISLR